MSFYLHLKHESIGKHFGFASVIVEQSKSFQQSH
nr:MAG TPA: hypothetical protein [Bacteriophage sp.]